MDSPACAQPLMSREAESSREHIVGDSMLIQWDLDVREETNMLSYF